MKPLSWPIPLDGAHGARDHPCRQPRALFEFDNVPLNVSGVSILDSQAERDRPFLLIEPKQIMLRWADVPRHEFGKRQPSPKAIFEYGIDQFTVGTLAKDVACGVMYIT